LWSKQTHTGSGNWEVRGIKMQLGRVHICSGPGQQVALATEDWAFEAYMCHVGAWFRARRCSDSRGS